MNIPAEIVGSFILGVMVIVILYSSVIVFYARRLGFHCRKCLFYYIGAIDWPHSQDKEDTKT